MEKNKDEIDLYVVLDRIRKSVNMLMETEDYILFYLRHLEETANEETD